MANEFRSRISATSLSCLAFVASDKELELTLNSSRAGLPEGEDGARAATHFPRPSSMPAAGVRGCSASDIQLFSGHGPEIAISYRLCTVRPRPSKGEGNRSDPERHGGRPRGWATRGSAASVPPHTADPAMPRPLRPRHPRRPRAARRRRAGRLGGDAGRGHRRASARARRRRPPPSPTTAACWCCPAWSMATCTPPPPPAGRGSRAPRCRPPPAASPPASTCPTTCRGR